MQKRSIGYLAPLASVLCVPAAVHAQSESAGFKLEEVVVTAQRREQNLQEVPISVSTFSAETLERANIRGATDYLKMTPNVSYTEDGQQGTRGLGLAIRGVNNLVSGENAVVNSNGIYLDQFSIASVPNGVANPLLIDMERVEVLRGPQGTLFGRNALGGALNLTTQAPTNELEGELSLGLESYNKAGDMYNLTGVLNVPVSDTFKVRGVAFYEDSSGLVKNIGPGTADSGHEWLDLRLRALWDLSPDTSISLTLMYSNQDQGTDENVPTGVNDLDTVDTFAYQPGVAFDPGTGFFPNNQNKLSHDLDESNKLDTTVAIANLSHRFSDNLTFKGIAGIIDATQKRLFDQDTIGFADVLMRDNVYDGKSWSFEGRLESTGDKLDWVVGAMYANDLQRQSNHVRVSSDPTALNDPDAGPPGFGGSVPVPGMFFPPFPTGLDLYLVNKSFELQSLAIFTDLTWHLTDRLDLIAGARYSNDDVKVVRKSFGVAPGCPTCEDLGEFFGSFINVPRPDAIGKTSYDDVAPRLGLRYEFTDSASVYATVSKGYKAGGSSTGNDTNAPGEPPIVIDYKAETLWNYEVGFKSEFADGRVRLNGSVFFLDWKNLQLEAFRLLTPSDVSSNFEQTVNVDAEATGAELELLARPIDRLTVGLGIGYMDSKITDEPACENLAAGPTCIRISGGFDVSAIGLEIPKAAKLTASAFAEYRFPLGATDAWLRSEYVHRDSIYSDIEALTNRQTRGPSPNQGLVRVVGPDEFPYKVPAYDVVNLRAGVDLGRFSISAYIENLFDEAYYTGTQENFGVSGIRVRPHPMTFGAKFGVRF